MRPEGGAMSREHEASLGDDATFAGVAKRRHADRSLGDERTVGDAAGGQDTAIDDIDVVDLESRYRIEGTLGQGGMGAVLLATDTRLGRKVAIKRILGESSGNRTAVNRFLTEAKSIAAINHPNIVQIYDYGRAKDGPFLIMEYVDGSSLLDCCRDGALPLEQVVILACQLCDGLAKAHDLGIIHRDIKPANVLLTKDGLPKLTDFGLAKAEAIDHGQTVTGAVLGTPDFMPPEQRRDASLVDARSDLWSLAATIYQMVTGRSPKIIRFDLLPVELTKVLGKALEDSKDARYQSARELRDALKASLLATASTETATAAGEGQCLACGEHNDTRRKFCRGCGGSLETPCLSCTHPMPLWEEICGSCGAKQSLLTDQKRDEMAVEQARAEGLLGDYDFDGAIALASQLRDEPHPKLRQLRGWAEAFLAEVEKSRAQQVEAVAESAHEAAVHEQAHDYLSAILALEGVPESLREVTIPGRSEAVAVALTRLKKKQADVRRLSSLVQERLAAKAFDGLLPEVEHLLALQPERKDLCRVKEQLVERMKRKVASREAAIEAARANLSKHDYENAVRSLSTISSDFVTPEVAELRNRAERAAQALRGHMSRLREGLAVKQLDGLLKTADEALRLKPGDPELLRVRQRMETYEKQRVEEIAAAIANAAALERSGQCAAAAELLSRIPESRHSLPVQQAIARCRELADRRASLLGSLDTKDESSLRAAITEARDYLHRLNDAGIKDNAFVEELEEAESLASSFKRSRSVPVFATRVFDWPSEAFAWCADVITDTTSDPRVIILIVALVFFIWFYLNFGVGDQ
jgi:predicted Ser/Thr protein kinase